MKNSGIIDAFLTLFREAENHFTFAEELLEQTRKPKISFIILNLKIPIIKNQLKKPPNLKEFVNSVDSIKTRSKN